MCILLIESVKLDYSNIAYQAIAKHFRTSLVYVWGSLRIHFDFKDCSSFISMRCLVLQIFFIRPTLNADYINLKIFSKSNNDIGMVVFNQLALLEKFLND